MTCDCSASRASRRPISMAAAPPTPASTSSKTKVGTGSLPAMTTSIASITRESSPPDAPARDRPRLGARMRLQQDRDLVAAVRGGFVLGVDAHGEARVGHRQRRELGGDRVGEARGRVGAQLGESGRRAGRPRRRDPPTEASSSSMRSSSPSSSTSRSPPVRRNSSTSSRVPPCRRTSAVSSARRSCTTSSSRAAVGVEAGEVARRARSRHPRAGSRRSAAPRRSGASAGSWSTTRSRWRRALSTSATASGASVDEVFGRHERPAPARRRARSSSRFDSRSARSASSTSSPGCGSAASTSSSAVAQLARPRGRGHRARSREHARARRHRPATR